MKEGVKEANNEAEFIARFGANGGYIREMYLRFLDNPELVEEAWVRFFREHGLAAAAAPAAAPMEGRPAAAFVEAGFPEAQEKVLRLVEAYRSRGHLAARVNPLTQADRLPAALELDPASYRFHREDLAREFRCAGFCGKPQERLDRLVAGLREVYCGSIGFETAHLYSMEERAWLRARIEARRLPHYGLSKTRRIRLLQKLIDAEAFETQLHKKFVGHKRFSLQGGESAVAMIDALLEESGRSGAREVVMGMAHRGRINILRNILGKPLIELFSEFEDQNIFTVMGSGDMKYHLGFESEYYTPQGDPLNVALIPNPSHLEFVSPVVLGICRARRTERYADQRSAVVPLLLHGDAAFVGEGIATETLNLSRLSGYEADGALHLVINNQIGFTTGTEEARSCTYCTDFAKAVQAPVFHVNGDDPEAACWAMLLAFEFRRRFRRDAVVDLYCYRRYGHNEADDPSFTQPLMYAEIEGRESPAESYARQLITEGLITAAQIDAYREKIHRSFEAAYTEVRGAPQLGEACPVHGRLREDPRPTAVSREALERAAMAHCTVPENFVVHAKVARLLEKRLEQFSQDAGIDWGFSETLAFGTLLLEGIPVRLSGEDSGRGTFGQRHVLLSNHETGERYAPLSGLADDGYARFEVYNSPLSEAAVLGFEFGYAHANPETLVLWEAQFGDFANAAQVMIDQFIACSEQKWGQRSGVVLLLPHGYEGQGPEHSSARLERYLQLAADGNISVCYPSTAAQYFHLLRRQALAEIKRPLIVMTPKSFLRAPEAAAKITDLTHGSFSPVLKDDLSKGGAIEQVLFVSGKVFYDVRSSLTRLNDARTRIVRLEQLYPFPQAAVAEVLHGIEPSRYLWLQEEPVNMGAWSYVKPLLRDELSLPIECISRAASGSTSTGSAARHGAEQKALIHELLRRIYE